MNLHDVLAGRGPCFVALVAGACALSLPLAAQPLTIPTVVVGDPVNPADPLNSGSIPGIGSVRYEYRIGKYEVTNSQYAFFLNAVAASDPYGLYNTAMDSSGLGVYADGGITRSGSPGTYTYAVKPGYANMPVVHVSFWDAARFANWLGTGTTEGRTAPASPLLPGAAYDTNFVVSPAYAAGDRLDEAAVFLPSENEWYKAAYYHPQSAGGPGDNYWLYATRSDTQPTSRTPAAFPNSVNHYFDDGVANGINGGYAVTQGTTFDSTQNYLTDVGAYGPDSESFVGTADQNGNVAEWSDSAFPADRRVLRGGTFLDDESILRSEFPSSGNILVEGFAVGFRVASLAPIPEPGTYAALAGALALAVVLLRRKR